MHGLRRGIPAVVLLVAFSAAAEARDYYGDTSYDLLTARSLGYGDQRNHRPSEVAYGDRRFRLARPRSGSDKVQQFAAWAQVGCHGGILAAPGPDPRSGSPLLEPLSYALSLG